MAMRMENGNGNEKNESENENGACENDGTSIVPSIWTLTETLIGGESENESRRAPAVGSVQQGSAEAPAPLASSCQ